MIWVENAVGKILYSSLAFDSSVVAGPHLWG